MSVMISSRDLYKLIARLIEHPDPTICKHHVAEGILDLIGRNGESLNIELVKAISDADDWAALKILKEITA